MPTTNLPPERHPCYCGGRIRGGHHSIYGCHSDGVGPMKSCADCIIWTLTAERDEARGALKKIAESEGTEAPCRWARSIAREALRGGGG